MATCCLTLRLRRCGRFHRRQQALLTIVAHPNDHPRTSDLIVEEDGLVKAILPHGQPREHDYRNLVPAGLYLASPAFLRQLEARREGRYDPRRAADAGRFRCADRSLQYARISARRRQPGPARTGRARSCCRPGGGSEQRPSPAGDIFRLRWRSQRGAGTAGCRDRGRCESSFLAQALQYGARARRACSRSRSPTGRRSPRDLSPSRVLTTFWAGSKHCWPRTAACSIAFTSVRIIPRPDFPAKFRRSRSAANAASRARCCCDAPWLICRSISDDQCSSATVCATSAPHAISEFGLMACAPAPAAAIGSATGARLAPRQSPI